MKYLLSTLVFLLVPLGLVCAEDPSVEINKDYYTGTVKQPFLGDPGGSKKGEVYRNTKVKVIETKNDWVKVSIEGWLRESSLISKARVSSTEAKEDSSLLTVVSFDTKHDTKNRQSPRAYLNIVIKNNSPEYVFAWRGVLTVENEFGELLFQERVVADKMTIEPGKEESTSFFWDATDSEYQKVLTITPENAKVSLKKVKLN